MVEETTRVPFSEVYLKVSDALDDAYGDMGSALYMTGELDRALREWCAIVDFRPEEEGPFQSFCEVFKEWCLFDRMLDDGSTFLELLAKDEGGIYSEIADTQAFRPMLVGEPTEGGIKLGLIGAGKVRRCVDAYVPDAIKHARRWRGMMLSTRLALVDGHWVQVGSALFTDRAGLSGVVPVPVGGSALAVTAKLVFDACSSTIRVL